MPASLHETQYVFVCHAGYKPPLTPLYKGPFLVLRDSDKAFKIDIQGHYDWVSIDRLKPAYVLPVPRQFTRKGRVTHPPLCFGFDC